MTPKQIEALHAIRAGKVENHRYGTGAWRITGPIQPTVVGHVCAMGLMKWVWGPHPRDVELAVLTDKGNMELDALQGASHD